MAVRGARSKSVAAIVAVVCMVAVVPVQTKIDAMRTRLVAERVMPTQMPLAAAASAALGGFRGLAVDILWIQSDSMINERQFYQLTTYYTLISTLQPNFTAVWTFNSWNLAFNIAAEWSQPDEKWLWVKKGLEFALEGLEYNPGSEDLNNWAGWLYFHSIGKNAYFNAKLQEEKGIEPFLEASKYFKNAYDVALEAGHTDVRYGSMTMRSLVEHADAVIKQTGNVPEAMQYYDMAEEGTKRLFAQYPNDGALMSLSARIKDTKAQLGR